MVDLARQANMTDIAVIPRTSISRSIVGMAHFAATGPAGETCGSCEFWQTPHGKKIVICEKFRQLTSVSTKAIPATTPCCRHYVPRQE